MRNLVGTVLQQRPWTPKVYAQICVGLLTSEVNLLDGVFTDNQFT